MIFTSRVKHSDLEGRHAFLSPSKHYWINYDDDKLKATYRTHLAAMRGERLHAFAKECIELEQPLPRNKKTLNRYVNDAIGYRLTPEQLLYYSDNCFGTADAIGFRHNILRIHDLKTGTSKTSMVQLRIYAALFCLEYGVEPESISDIELRIYQMDTITVEHAESVVVRDIMNTICHFDDLIDSMGPMY